MGNCNTCQNCTDGKTEFNDQNGGGGDVRSSMTLNPQAKNYMTK